MVLRSAWAGVFFVVVDKYSETSNIFKMLTQTNLAVPIDQLCARMVHTAAGPGLSVAPAPPIGLSIHVL